MARIIKYTPKITSARTEYREIDPEDLTWLKSELIQWLSIMGELDMSRDEDSRWVRDQWWHKRTSTLPKGKEGQNTPCSFISGLINNLVFGSQRDITDKQMDAIQNISSVMGGAYSTCTQIRFQIGFSF
jgi:hypothetical protein